MIGTSQVYGGLGIEASLGNDCDATSQTDDSLLVPIYRIIAKNVKCIDLANIDRHHKRANQNALNHFLSGFDGCYFKDGKSTPIYQTKEWQLQLKRIMHEHYEGK